MTTEMICAGFGGQGVLTAGLIFIHAASGAGLNVTWSPSYGSEMRGGTANCYVVASDEEIGSPIPRNVDVLMVLNEPSVEKFEASVRPNGIVIANSSIIDPSIISRRDISLWCVPATEIANELENSRGTNIVMLGALLKAAPIIELPVFAAELEKYFSGKGKVNAKNGLCLDAGFERAVRVEI
ncbi:MAG: 2-oxoacid:acceptor oxidoreductase family protein [Oscillospiraceae bacterium]